MGEARLHRGVLQETILFLAQSHLRAVEVEVLMLQDLHLLAVLAAVQAQVIIMPLAATLQVQVHLKEQVVVAAAPAAAVAAAAVALLEHQEVLVLREQGQWELVATVVMEQPHQLLALL
jgi:hypothetical protein